MGPLSDHKPPSSAHASHPVPFSLLTSYFSRPEGGPMKLLRDTWLIFPRHLRATLRNPVWVIVGLTQPLYFLILFAPLLDTIARAPGFPAGSSLNTFVPGLLSQLGFFGTAFVGFGLIA